MLKLIIGNKNYSSWSLRPWLLLKQFKVDFKEVRIALNLQETPTELRELSPTCKVPVLYDGDQVIWDSLSICEYISENFLDGRGWPRAAIDRAIARSVAAEMHAGFQELRHQWPMNIRLQRQLAVNGELQQDIDRIEQLWEECLLRSGGPCLFGDFSITDAMYAPVVLRFRSYQPALGSAADQYCKTLLDNPALQEWMQAAVSETEVIREDEVGYLLGETGW